MRPLVIIIVLFALVGCKTYTITPQSLREQLAQAEPRQVRTHFGVAARSSYTANGLSFIRCIDKSGKETVLPNGPQMEVRITTDQGKRRIMYFDRLLLSNDTLIGGPSRFISDITYRISFSSIIKVEVQDGGKSMYYE